MWVCVASPPPPIPPRPPALTILPSPITPTEKFSIGRVFDEEGTFWEEGLARYVETAADRFKRGQWDELEGGGGGGGKKEGKKNK